MSSPAWDVPFRIVVIVGVLLAVSAMTWTQRLASETRRNVACQQRYNDIINARTNALAEAAAAERAVEADQDEAQRQESESFGLLVGFLNAPPTGDAASRQAVFQKLIADYDTKLAAKNRALEESKQKRAAYAAAQAEHPLPPPPSQSCGKI